MRNGFPGINYLLQLVGYCSHTASGAPGSIQIDVFQIQRFLIFFLLDYIPSSWNLTSFLYPKIFDIHEIKILQKFWVLLE